MAIQMRRGPLANYDKSKMLPGEWGISIDNDSDNQKAFISFAPGVSKEVLFTDSFAQIQEMFDDALGEAEAWAHGNSFTVDHYDSGDGETTEFTLKHVPSEVLGVYVDGVGTSAYTLTGKVITFNTAPPVGSNNIYVNYVVDTSTDNANYYKNRASNFANNASAAATTATNKANNAASSATTAANKANSAASSATAASNYATTASQKATAAASSATAAANSATTASQRAASATDSAISAQTSSRNSEAWAVGTRNGTPVSSSDPQYHNNAKYYTELLIQTGIVATGDGTVTLSLATIQ